MATSILALGLALVGCADASIDGEAEELHEHGDDDHDIGQVSAALAANATVNDAVTSSCTTASVKGLATQLVEEIQCLRPGTMKRIDDVQGFRLGDAVFPYLQTPAADALIGAQRARNATMSLNSGLRTLPQQFLLYRWYKTGRCGIGLAATPGTSNHESAIAIDIQDNAAWRGSLQGRGFRWLGANDPVHYDFTAKGAVDIRGLSVRAFQRLWNRNHPDDNIGEDGDYGDETSKRLARAPANGFAVGAVCDGTTADAAPMSDVPETPDGEEGGATTKNKSGLGDEDDEDYRRRQRAEMAGVGCAAGSTGATGSTGSTGPLAPGALPFLALVGLGFAFRKGARRRAR